eukprot:3641773-Pleurochrysis_carterae.AAC.2
MACKVFGCIFRLGLTMFDPCRKGSCSSPPAIGGETGMALSIRAGAKCLLKGCSATPGAVAHDRASAHAKADALSRERSNAEPKA